jgi:hypothetical protein
MRSFSSSSSSSSFFNRATYQGKEKKWLAQIFIHFGMMLKR